MSDYRIPIMNIQGVLVEMGSHAGFIALRMFCKKNLERTNHFPGRQPDPFFKIDFELERRWYPVLITNDRYLATMVMKTFVGTEE